MKKRRKSKLIICEVCGRKRKKKFSQYERMKHHYCSVKCSQIGRKGFKHSKRTIKQMSIFRKNNPNVLKHMKKMNLLNKGNSYWKLATHPKGENHYAWKGDRVKKGALHTWLRKEKVKPNVCERCKKVPPYEIANISGKYLRDVNDYAYLCRRCHLESDGRLAKFSKHRFTKRQS